MKRGTFVFRTIIVKAYHALVNVPKAKTMQVSQRPNPCLHGPLSLVE